MSAFALYLTLFSAATTLVSASLAPRASPGAYSCKVCPTPPTTDAYGPYPFQLEYFYSDHVSCQYYNSANNHGKECYYSIPSGMIMNPQSDAGCAASLAAVNYPCPAATSSSGSFNGGALNADSQSVACAYANLQYMCNYSESGGTLISNGSDSQCQSKVGTQAQSCASLPSRRRRHLDNFVATQHKRRAQSLAPPAPRSLPESSLTRSTMESRARKWKSR